MEEDKILKIIEEICIKKDDKKYLACDTAFKIAKELNINVSIIGKVCNEKKIKIKHCQIGCF